MSIRSVFQSKIILLKPAISNSADDVRIIRTNGLLFPDIDNKEQSFTNIYG